MGWFDFLKPQKKSLLRVTVKSGISINGSRALTTVYDEIIDHRGSRSEDKESDVLDGYEIKHNTFKSLKDANERKIKYQGILNRERANGFAIKGGGNLYTLTSDDKLSIREFDVLIKPILKEIKKKSLEDSINNIASLYRLFNKTNHKQISIGYARWYFEFATILFDIENQFKKK